MRLFENFDFNDNDEMAVINKLVNGNHRYVCTHNIKSFLVKHFDEWKQQSLYVGALNKLDWVSPNYLKLCKKIVNSFFASISLNLIILFFYRTMSAAIPCVELDSEGMEVKDYIEFKSRTDKKEVKSLEDFFDKVIDYLFSNDDIIDYLCQEFKNNPSLKDYKLCESFSFDEDNEDEEEVSKIISGNKKYIFLEKLEPYIRNRFKEWKKSLAYREQKRHTRSSWILFNDFLEHELELPLFLAIAGYHYDKNHNQVGTISAWYDPTDSLEFDDYIYFSNYSKPIENMECMTLERILDFSLDYFLRDNMEIADIFYEKFKNEID